MTDEFTCKRCGRIVHSGRYGEKSSTKYWSLKKLRLCSSCI